MVSMLLLSTTVLVLCGFSRQSSIDDLEPFRMRKVNIVWRQAKMLSLSKERMNELFVDLQLHDKDELKLKKKRAEGLDKDGEMEAVVRRNLERIVEKFGINKRDESSELPDNFLEMESNRVLTPRHARDERLDKLWKAAVEEGQFTKHELEELRTELDHHHEKWRQYNDLLGLVSEHEQKTANSIGKKSLNEETLSKLQEEMNIKQREVDRNYRRLKTKVVAGSEDQDFTDSRVIELWRRAKARIKSEDELAILKEELKHFDVKIAKHDDLRDQLDVAEDLLGQGYDHIQQKHDKLSSKVKEHRKYIKKMHKTLSDKIGLHTEL